MQQTISAVGKRKLLVYMFFRYFASNDQPLFYFVLCFGLEGNPLFLFLAVQFSPWKVKSWNIEYKDKITIRMRTEEIYQGKQKLYKTRVLEIQ